MNLDIIPNGAIKRVHVSQNDVGRTLTFELFNNSTSYTIPSGATVKIQGTKPSGFGFSETCTVSGNVVTVDTTEAMTDEHGYIEAELQITNSGDVIGTANFVLAIEKNPHPSNTTDGTQITAQSLQTQIDALQEEIEGGGGGLTNEAKQALLDCLAHVAWIDEDGQDYYDALENALYTPAVLVSISAVYTQTKTVFNTDELNELKDELVVTAHFDDNSSRNVTDYTLSGTLESGTSTITVTYSTETTTFTVAVDELDLTLPSGYTAYDFISNPSPAFSSSTNRAQMVNTGLSGSYCSSNYSHELEFAITSDANSTGYALYGCRTTTGQDLTARCYFVSLANSINYISAYYDGTYVHGNDSLVASLNTKYNFVTKNGTWYINGESYKNNLHVEGYEPYTSGYIALWGCSTGGSNASALTNTMKVYKFAVRNQTTGDYVAYMIPAKNSSNTSGLYDVIRSQFYTASTASKLLADNDE